MKFTALILLWLAMATAPAQTNQGGAFRYPVRIFSAKSAVNLTPLFEWWKTQPLTNNPATNKVSASTTNTPDETESDRPLTSWYRVSGVKVGVLAGGAWLVDAVVYTGPTLHTNARIILNRPPAAEEQAYYTLKMQLADAILQITNAQRSYQASTDAERKDRAVVRANPPASSKPALGIAANYSRRAAEQHERAQNALAQKKQAEAARDQLQKQLSAIPAVNGSYRIDWFALSLGPTKQGVPIYDLGLLGAGPP